MARSTSIGILMLAFAAGAWWLSSPAPVADSSSAGGPTGFDQAEPPLPSPPAPERSEWTVGGQPSTPPAPPTATDAPPGLSPAQWAQVLGRLQSRPDAAEEQQRLHDYFSWSDAVQRWRSAPTDASLAAQVDAGLPARLAQREVSAAEARQIKAALLGVLEPDADRQAAALQAFDAQLPAPTGPDPRQRAFEQEQAAVVAAWRRTPAAERDPKALARQLASLRQSHFQSSPVVDNASATGTSPGR
jgi:hypothetical protein